ncbi:MAG: methyltransferase [Thermoguttaceae bacterium]|nr:methyltransferase [Thermoguttaceae bacterium]
MQKEKAMADVFETLMEMSRGYEVASVLIAASELDLFTEILRVQYATVANLSLSLRADERGLSILTDALVSLGLLEKVDGCFQVPEEYRETLDSRSSSTLIPMLRHRGSCMKSWSQLAWTVKSGSPFPSTESIHGALDDYRAFVLGMHSIGLRMAGPLVEQMKANGFPGFKRMLDLGGASGTYTAAFLKSYANSEAIIFDLPVAIAEAKLRFATSDLAPRIAFVAGDFYQDSFPDDVDFIWVSAIIHQQSVCQTATMFGQAFAAMRRGGIIAVRDIFAQADRTGPVAATLFGVNMLSRTEQGRVYTFNEVRDLLERAGFCNAKFLTERSDMGSVIVAVKP